VTYTPTVFILSALLYSLNAFGTTKIKDEFPYIKPVSVEYVEIQPDSDGDLVFDKNDKCPNTKAGAIVDKFGCKIKTDLDGDGIFDEQDKCPNSAKDVSVDENGCELDSDFDGVIDSKDECPDTSVDFKVDDSGCPKTATLKVQFKPYKYDITENTTQNIKTFAQFLKENIGYQVIIYGYTDSSGDKFKNKILSQYRANSVRKALISYGIDRHRLTAIGKGSQNPIADNSTAEGRILNRRIEVELVK
jgi:OOP family OmpA-OmpF porin